MMDTTPEYIRMCEAATEIQEAWEPRAGDYYFAKERRGRIFPGYMYIGIDVPAVRVICRPEAYNFIEGDIWLPRQDQLQAMVQDQRSSAQMAQWLAEWLRAYNYCLEYLSGDASMEQLWLAFVMNEKYNQRWDSEKKEWVKE